MSSRFEFLSSTTLGQYIPNSSWFHQRDPRARLITFIFIFLGITFTQGFWGLGLGLISLCIVFLLAKLPLKLAMQSIAKTLPFIFILAVIQVIFYTSNDQGIVWWKIFSLEINNLAAFSALSLLLRFMLMISLLNAMISSLSTSQITAAIFYLLKPLEKIKFPVNDLTMIIQITLRFIPILALTAEKTAKAQAARGADWEKHGFNPVRQVKRVLPLLIPIFINSLKQAEQMALAMEARGFNAGDQRSCYYMLRFNWVDGVLISSSMVISGLMIFSMFIR